MNPQSFQWHTTTFLIITFLLSIVAYSNTFDGEFQFDDDTSILENPYVTGNSKFSCSDYFKGTLSGSRPVTTITFALNHHLGKIAVRGYHVTNFIIHVINGMLIFTFVLLIMRSPGLPITYHNRALFVALLSSAIFLLHPIQTEAVSYISQRYESLASLFYLLSLIAYIKARQTAEAEVKVKIKIFSTSTFYFLSVFSGILAIGSKEIAVTIPVVILLYEVYFLDGEPVLKRVAVPGVFIILSFIAGIFILSGFNKSIDAGFSVKDFTPWEYLMTQFRVITTYIRLVFLPINQNLDYDFRISRSLFEADTFLSLIFLLGLIVTAILVFKRRRVGSFFILWFFIILSPTSSIIPIIDPIFEHRVYLASAGIFIIISDILSRLILRPNPYADKSAQRNMKISSSFPDLIGESREKELDSLVKPENDRLKGKCIFGTNGKVIYNRIGVLCIVGLMVLLSVATFQRNKVWDTKLSLWEDATKKSPLKSRVHNNLGNCYMLLSRNFEAIEEYKKAISLDKNNIEAYYNIGINLERIGLLNKAIYYYDIFYRNAPAKYDEQKKIVRERIDSFYK